MVKMNNANTNTSGYADPNKLVLLATTIAVTMADDLSIEELSTLTNLIYLVAETLEAILNQKEINQGNVIQPF